MTQKRMLYDFRAPFMSAVIVTPNGTRLPLWTDLNLTAAQLDSIHLGVSSLPYLSEIEITIPLGDVPTIRAQLTPPFKDGRAFLNSAAIEWGFSTIEVQFGYSGGNGQVVLSPVFSAILLKPDVSVGSDVSITLNGQGSGGFGSLRTQQAGVLRGTRLEIVEALARGDRPGATTTSLVHHTGPSNGAAFGGVSGLGGVSSQDDSLTEGTLDDNLEFFLQQQQVVVVQHPTQKGTRRLAVDLSHLKGTPEEKRMNEELEVHPGGMSDWAQINEVLREAGCWSFIGTDDLGNPTIFVISRDKMLAGEPSRTFRFFDFPEGQLGHGDPAAFGGDFPILEINSPTMAVYLPGGSRGFRMQDIDDESRQFVQNIINDQSVAPGRSGQSAAESPPSGEIPGTDTNTGDGTTLVQGDPNDNRAVDMAKAEYAAWTGSMGINLDVTSIGIPTLLPGETVQVWGMGERLDHQYGVLTVKHTIGGNGFSTSWNGVSNVQQFEQKLFESDPAAGRYPASPPGDYSTGSAGFAYSGQDTVPIVVEEIA